MRYNQIRGQEINSHQKEFLNSQQQQTKTQILDNFIPEWKKKYIDISAVDNCLNLLQTNGVHVDVNYLITQIGTQVGNAVQFIDEQMDSFASKFVDLKEQSLYMKRQSKSFQEKCLNNIFELYKLLSLLQNFGSINAMIVNYFVDSAQSICFDQNIADFTSAIEGNSLFAKFTDIQFYKSKKLNVVKLLSKIAKISVMKAQNDLDKSLLPPVMKINWERITYMSVGMTLILAILIGTTLISEFILYNSSEMRLTMFQRLMIRYLLAIYFYWFMLFIVFRQCERRQINWQFIYGIEKSWLPVGARQILQRGLFSFSVTCFFCVLSIIANTIDRETNSTPILQMQLGHWFSQLAVMINAEYWLLFPLALYVFNIFRGIFEIVMKRQKFYGYLLKLQLSVLFPFFTLPRFNLIVTSIDFASIPQMCVHLGSAFNYLLFKKDLPGWSKFLLFNYPLLIRLTQLSKLVRIKPGWNPHWMNFCKFSSLFPYSFTYFEDIHAISWLNHLLIGTRYFDSLFKIYWDACQECGLFISGQGSNKFLNKSGEWRHKIICRRPTCLPIWWLTLTIIINPVMRFDWVPKMYVDKTKHDDYFYDTISLFSSLLRMSLIMFARLDNQQATNQEDLLVNNFVPLPIQQQITSKPASAYNVQNYDLVNAEPSLTHPESEGNYRMSEAQLLGNIE